MGLVLEVKQWLKGADSCGWGTLSVQGTVLVLKGSYKVRGLGTWFLTDVSSGLHRLTCTISVTRLLHPGEPGKAWPYRYEDPVQQCAHAACINGINKALFVLFSAWFSCAHWLKCCCALHCLLDKVCYSFLATLGFCYNGESNKLNGHRFGFKGAKPV